MRTFGGQQIACAEGPLDEIFRMAVARDSLFEQKGDHVVGLQDCVIALSILDRLGNGPVCPVVWQGSVGDRRPYADQLVITALFLVSCNRRQKQPRKQPGVHKPR